MIAVPIALRYEGAGCLAITPSTGAIRCVACGAGVSSNRAVCCFFTQEQAAAGEHAQLLALAAMPDVVTALLELVHAEARVIALALDAVVATGHAVEDLAVVVLGAGHMAIDPALADAVGRYPVLSVKLRAQVVASARASSPATAVLLARAPAPGSTWCLVRDGRVELVALLSRDASDEINRTPPLVLVSDAFGTRVSAAAPDASAATATEPLQKAAQTGASAAATDADETLIDRSVR